MTLAHPVTVGFTLAMMISTRNISGKAEVTSPTRMMIVSIHLPKYPDKRPNVRPRAKLPVTRETTVIITVVRSP